MTMDAELTATIPGLPESVEPVRFGRLDFVLDAEPKEFVLTDRGVMEVKGFGLIVRLKPGWVRRYNPAYDTFSIIRPFDQPEVLQFEVRDQYEKDAMNAAYANLVAMRT
jgi:hypothetical protein